MESQAEIDKFATELEQDLAKDNVKDNEYCVMILVGPGGSFTSGRPSFVYKSVSDFKEKAIEDLKKIDPSKRVDILLWKFN